MNVKRDHLINGIAYGAATTGCLLAITSGNHLLEYVCRPMMMLVLSSWFFFNSRPFGDRFTLLIQAGLFFSLIGDVALMFQYVDEFNFLIGLGAFLIAYLCYCMAFLYNITEVGGTEGMLLASGISIVLVLFAILFSWDLIPRLGEGVSLPVISYVVSITAMGVLAAFRFTRTFPRSFWMVMAGALLFVVSDSLLAVNRFIEPLPWGPFAVMITYALAQPLIAAGALLHVMDPESIRRKQALEA